MVRVEGDSTALRHARRAGHYPRGLSTRGQRASLWEHRAGHMRGLDPPRQRPQKRDDGIDLIVAKLFAKLVVCHQSDHLTEVWNRAIVEVRPRVCHMAQTRHLEHTQVLRLPCPLVLAGILAPVLTLGAQLLC